MKRTTNKEKEVIEDTIYSDYVIPFMTDVMTLAIQEEFEHRHNLLMTKFSTLEEATWVDQICEATAYIADNSFETKLIHKLAEVRDLTTLQFATKIVDKQAEFKTKLYDLAVAEQKMIHIVTGCTTVRDLNVVLEDYFSVAMSNAQCLEYGRCTTNEETGNIERKVKFDYSGGSSSDYHIRETLEDLKHISEYDVDKFDEALMAWSEQQHFGQTKPKRYFVVNSGIPIQTNTSGNDGDTG